MEDIHKLELLNINFGYTEKLLLNDFSQTFEKSKPSVIIGPSGKGKTTLLRVLKGMHEPFSGEVLLHTGSGILTMSSSYRRNIAFVPQGDKLLTGTVLYNLNGNSASIPIEAIEEALRISCAEFVKDLPSRLNTIVGEGGFGLSEGQAQRLALARAVLQDCKIWLMDEVTSALDEDSGARMIANIMEAGKDKILVFVTHDQKVSSLCDNKVYI